MGAESNAYCGKVKEAVFIKVNNPPLNQNIGQFNLPPIYDQLLISGWGGGKLLFSFFKSCVCLSVSTLRSNHLIEGDENWHWQWPWWNLTQVRTSMSYVKGHGHRVMRVESKLQLSHLFVFVTRDTIKMENFPWKCEKENDNLYCTPHFALQMTIPTDS